MNNTSSPLRHGMALLPTNSPPWLHSLREKAEERFFTHGFPSLQEEGWKYTSTAHLRSQSFTSSLPTEATHDALQYIEKYRLPDAETWVFINGYYYSCYPLPSDALSQDSIRMPINTALEKYTETIQTHLSDDEIYPHHGLTYFAMAYFRDGMFISIPSDFIFPHPIQLLHIVTQKETLSPTYHIVCLGKNAQANIIETYVGIKETSYFTTAITKLYLREGSKLEHYKLQIEGNQAYHFGEIVLEQHPFSQFYQYHAAFGGVLAKTEIHSTLGANTQSALHGLHISNGRRHLDTYARVLHTAPHGTTRIQYRGLASERGRGVFSGRIVVEKKAEKTDATLDSHHLVLSPYAEIDTEPHLEIHTDDIKCAHGVTIGQLDMECLFYLTSRGIDESEARALLTLAFANKSLDAVRLSSVHTLLLREWEEISV